MARLVLHVGTHKTGTTMVQDTLHANRGLLAEHGVIYPDLGPHTGHHGFLTDWIALPAAYALPGGGRQALQRLAEKWRDSDRTVFLSSEELSRAGGSGGCVDFPELRDVFSGYDIRVLCVLRQQWQFLQSVFVEIARTRPPPRPPEMLRAAVETGIVDGVFCDYSALYERLKTGFDPATLHFIDYAHACAAPGGLLAAVLAYVAPGLVTSSLTPVKGGRANVSPRALPVWAALVVAGGMLPAPVLRRAAAEAFDLEYGAQRPVCLFTRAELQQIEGCFASRNAHFIRQVASHQPGFALTAQDVPETTVFREDVGADLWIRLARRLVMGMETAAQV